MTFSGSAAKAFSHSPPGTPSAQSPSAGPGSEPPHCTAIVPCAGIGQRAGRSGPKQYAVIEGLPVVCWSLLALDACPAIHSLWCVVAPDDPQIDVVLGPIRSRLSKPLRVVRQGGATRAESVRAGLQAVLEAGLPPESWALVHDAARCLVHPSDVQRLVERVLQHSEGGLLAAPVADTLKRANALGQVQTTVSRERLWAAQTPQMFRLGALAQALDAAAAQGLPVTDEASAIEAAGGYPVLVESFFENFKLTYPQDFERAAQVLRLRPGTAALSASSECL